MLHGGGGGGGNGRGIGMRRKLARGAMEAIYFGNAHWQGNTGGGGTGPWVGADLEAGMFYGGEPHVC